MKVLYVHDYGEVGAGAEASLMLMLRHVGSINVEPTCACPSPGSLADAIDKLGIWTARLPLATPSIRSGWRKAVGSVIDIGWGQIVVVKIIRKTRPEVIHANSVLAAITAVLPSKLTRTPLLCHVRIFVHPTAPSKLAFKLLSRLGVRFISISRAVTSHITQTFGIPEECISLLPNAVNMQDFQLSPTLDSSEFGFEANLPVVGIVGQIARHKGQDDFIEMASKLRSRLPDVRFVIVGGEVDWAGPYRMETNELKRQIEDSGLVGIVTLLGPRSDIPSIMKSLSALVVPSKFEPFGRVVIEGMAAGTPVVAYAVGGIPEIIDDGVDGVLVSPDNIDELCDALLNVLQSPEEAGSISEKAQAKVAERYDIPAQMAGLKAIYKTALSS